VAGFLLSEKRKGEMKRRVVLFAAVFMLHWGLAKAEDVQLEKIVITAARYSQDIDKVSGSVDVITSDELEKTNAHNVLDAVRTALGLNVQDYYGTGVKANVDLRGFGETALSNILVLVDGRRVNEIDLSGVAWSQISLDQVDRIEILHGPQTVLYGDNAVGGVVNIITRKGSGRPKFVVDNSGGSYQMNRQVASVDGSWKKANYSLRASHYFTDGYRQNSDYGAKDFSVRLGNDFSDLFSLDLSGSFHAADFGLPGALYESDIDKWGRRYSKFPADRASEKDWYAMASPKLDFKDSGKLETNFSFRRREVDTIWGSYGIFSSSNSHSIDTLAITPKYIFKKNILGHDNTISSGLDFYKVDLISDDFDVTPTQTGHANVKKNSLALYSQDTFSISENLLFDLGYRWEKVKFNFDYTDLQGIFTNIDDTQEFNEQAFKGGLVYNYQPDSKLYLDISKGYRLPVVDEFILYNFWVLPFGRTINKDLKPQKALNYEIGIEHSWNPNFLLGLVFYWMKVKDEIYYNPYNYVNSNYDHTLHRAVELKAKGRMNKKLSLFGNYSFTKANFAGGEFGHNEIPAVPRHKATLGMDYNITDKLLFTLGLNYVGTRRFISDQKNEFGRLDDYLTVDIKFSYNWKKVKAYLGINNLFNEKYSEIGVIGALGRAYYPSPERNIFGGVSLEF